MRVCKRTAKRVIGAYLHLASIEVLGWVRNEPTSPVTLHTGDNVVGLALDTLRDDAEAVVLHCGGATDATEETLLNTLAKLDNRNTIRGLWNEASDVVYSCSAIRCAHSGDLDGDLADSQPRDANTEGDRLLVSPPRNTLTKHSQNRDEDSIPELLGANDLAASGSESAIGIRAVGERDKDPDADN